jgi:carbonic anhydrase/acetyltransferase-like protein (isoleucine patch superfamily)
MNHHVNIWDNVVIRGDINVVRIAGKVTIMQNCVIRTVASLPTGLPAVVWICNNIFLTRNLARNFSSWATKILT